MIFKTSIFSVREYNPTSLNESVNVSAKQNQIYEMRQDSCCFGVKPGLYLGASKSPCKALFSSELDPLPCDRPPESIVSGAARSRSVVPAG